MQGKDKRKTQHLKWYTFRPCQMDSIVDFAFKKSPCQKQAKLKEYGSL